MGLQAELDELGEMEGDEAMLAQQVSEEWAVQNELRLLLVLEGMSSQDDW